MQDLLKPFAILGILAVGSGGLAGCTLAAGAAGGAVAADELNEDDGEFDPLEETYDGDGVLIE